VGGWKFNPGSVFNFLSKHKYADVFLPFCVHIRFGRYPR
jgi:hypothetical protein